MTLKGEHPDQQDELESFVAVSPFSSAEDVPVETVEVSDAEFLSLRFYAQE